MIPAGKRFRQFIYSQVKGTPFLKHEGQEVNEIRLLRYVTTQVAEVLRAYSHNFVPRNFPSNISLPESNLIIVQQTTFIVSLRIRQTNFVLLYAYRYIRCTRWVYPRGGGITALASYALLFRVIAKGRR